MLPRWATLMRLPAEERMGYLQRLTPADQVEFTKITMLLTSEAIAMKKDAGQYFGECMAIGMAKNAKATGSDSSS